jgi:transposase
MGSYGGSRTETFIGLDVHKERIVGAMLTRCGEWKEGVFGQTGSGLRKLERWMGRESEGLARCCYEAGPCGYELWRRLRGSGLECMVVAPSLIPHAPGDRVKTDRRDARELARLLRAGMLTEVHPPTEEEEFDRDLCRCREAAREDVHRSRQRLLKFLQRHGYRWSGKHWTQGHWRWVRGLEFSQLAARKTFEEYVLAIEQVEARLGRLGREIAALGEEERYRGVVGGLRCFRGIDTLTAVVLATELYGFARFATPRELMSYLGLVSSERSSGEKQRRGAITKAGNGHVRRLLIEAAWHCGRRPGVGVGLGKRREGQAGEVIGQADRCMMRLYRRYHRLLARGKAPAVAVVAVARELAGFVWWVMRREALVA